MEHRVQIDPHQVVQVPLIPAGDGVDRLVRVGHGVEEGVQGAFHQFHKGLPHGVVGGTAEHRVLQDVEDAGVVPGPGGKTDAKGLVFLGAVQPDQPGAGGVVAQFPQYSLQFRQVPAGYPGETHTKSLLYRVRSEYFFLRTAISSLYFSRLRMISPSKPSSVTE